MRVGGPSRIIFEGGRSGYQETKGGVLGKTRKLLKNCFTVINRIGYIM